jgi:hypothetical protein
METIYYLFGGDASEFYIDNTGEMSPSELATAISEMDFSLALYDMYSHPSELLFEYDGWNGFAEISEEVYTLLISKIK